MGWGYLLPDPLALGLSGHFAGKNSEPEGGGNRPCVGPTPHLFSVSFQLPQLQAEPLQQPQPLEWTLQGQSLFGQVLAHLQFLGFFTEQSLVLREQPQGWTLGHTGFQDGSSLHSF